MNEIGKYSQFSPFNTSGYSGQTLEGRKVSFLNQNNLVTIAPFTGLGVKHNLNQLKQYQ